MFLGENANHGASKELSRAKQMEAEGVTAEEIHLETGWFRFSSGDNLWRYETDDKSLKFSHDFLDYLDDGSNEPVCIKDVFKDNPIMDSYHDFWNVYVIPMGDSPYGEMQGHNGFMNKHGSSGAVEINLKLGERSLVDLKTSLLHELQHVIQKIEGMAVGGNRTMFRDLNLLKEERVQSIDAMSDILRNNPEFYDDLAVVQAKLIQLYQYGDGMDLDWDNVPEEIADEYFDSIDVLSEKYPELESDYYDLHDLASRREFSFGSKQHITPLEQYYQLAGEIEAFQVSDRVGLTMDERRNELPRMMPRRVVGGLSPIVEFDSKKLVEKAWIEHRQINHRVIEDISRYSSDHFSRITSNKFAELDDLMSSVSNSFLTMMADVTEDLPEDNPLVIDFNKTTAWLGTTPREFRNMCYMSRRPFEKKFNQGLVNYLSEDPKHHPLRGVFSTVTDWMRAILEKLEGKLFEVEVSAEMKSVYENIFGEGGVDLESPFQKKLRSGLRDATNMSMDAELAVAAIMDSGYEKIAERAGIPKGELAEKYSIEFIRGKEPKPPKLENGQLRTPATMRF